MGEPVDSTAEPRERFIPLFSALLLDRHWTPDHSRKSLFLSLLLLGSLGGCLEGWALYDFRKGSYFDGDTFLWDAVEQFAWIGTATGMAVAAAMTIARNLIHRLTMSALFGVSLISGAVLIYSEGGSLEVWGLPQCREFEPILRHFINWGLYLGGSAVAAVMGCHLLRRCSGKVRLTLLALAIGCIVGLRSQFLFWAKWNPPHFDSRCFANPESYFPSWAGGLIQTSTLFSGILLIDLAARWLQRRGRIVLLPIGLAISTVLLMATLGWACQAMPFTRASELLHLEFSADGRYLVSAHLGGTVRLWELGDQGVPGIPSLKEIRKVRLHRGPNRDHIFALHPKFFASASDDGQISLWETSTLRPLLELSNLGTEFRSLRISPDGKILAAIDGQRVEHLWEIRLSDPDGIPRALPFTLLPYEKPNLSHRLQFSPDGRWFARSSMESYSVYDRASGLVAIGPRDTGRRSFGWELAFSPDSKLLAIEPCDGYLSLVEIPSGEIRHTLPHQPDYLHALAFSPDGRHLAAAYGSIVVVSDASSGEEALIAFPGESDMNWIKCVCYSPDGKRIAVGLRDGTIQIRRAPELQSAR